jgi:hypothetical protein
MDSNSLNNLKKIKMKTIFFNDYEIYEDGKVYSYKSNKYLKNLNREYPCVDLYINNKPKRYFIHRLIAENFIENIYNKPYVNHIDGDKYNYNINNLEWVTHKENIQHCWNNGLHKKIRPVKKVKCLETGKIYESVKEAAIILGYNHKTLCNMLNDKFHHRNKTNLKYIK